MMASKYLRRLKDIVFEGMLDNENNWITPSIGTPLFIIEPKSAGNLLHWNTPETLEPSLLRLNFQASAYPIEIDYSNSQTNEPVKESNNVETKKLKVVKTQKAKGIIFCLDQIVNPDSQMRLFFRNLEHRFIDERDSIKDNYFLPCFARPCPTEPRHGFVDSRVIKNNKELLSLWEEMMEQDPNGEIILGPYMPGIDYSSVFMSSGNLSIGSGNDGATAGKNSISFPVAPHSFKKSLNVEAGIGDEESVYLESVFNNGDWNLVQMRGGPYFESVSPDFIPKDTEVNRVILPINDLLEWERQVRDFEPGTVVYGKEHTLASHAAIHCVLNQIPFVTTFQPKVGETIKEIKEEKRKYSRKSFKEGVHVGLTISKGQEFSDMLSYFYFALSCLHNWNYLRHSAHAEWLMGAAAALFVKICTALALGEHRHKDRHEGGDRPRREDVYLQVLDQKTEPMYWLGDTLKDFYQRDWEEGFGGLPWATCTWYSHLLWKNIVSTYNRSGGVLAEKEVANIITTINKTVNLAHNNGWWFNKIAVSKDLDFIANSPGLAAACVADVFYNTYKKVSNVSDVKDKLRKPDKISPPFAINPEGKLMWLQLKSINKYTSLSLKLEGGETRQTHITLSEKEIESLHKRYKDLGLSVRNSLILRVTKSDNKFRIPGGPKRNLKEWFNVG